MIFLCYMTFSLLILSVHALFDNEINLECKGKRYENVTLTAYYPDMNDIDHEDAYLDIMGNKLISLQDFVDDRSQYVTLSMDPALEIPYGTSVCIPELNVHFGHRIRVQVRDSSSDLQAAGYKRAEICVRSESDSYDLAVNRFVTLVFES